MKHDKFFTFLEGAAGILLIQGLEIADFVELEKLILQSIIGALTIAALLLKLKKKKK